MQERHTNRKIYFDELATTTEQFIRPYIEKFKRIDTSTRILELGCGDGGNLVPFAQSGCNVLGIDLCEARINDAQTYFKEKGLQADFKVGNICKLPIEELGLFDIIICHDVIEHIEQNQKIVVLDTISKLLKEDGIAFIAFPAWYMPFGGHQQICRNRFLSHAPWIHLFPSSGYRWLLRRGKETDACIKELLSIKQTRITIEQFNRLVQDNKKISIIDRVLYLINPHYKVKFGLSPVVLPGFLAIPFMRNFLSTTCFFLLQKR